jgi:hypothetical protein
MSDIHRKERGAGVLRTLIDDREDRMDLSDLARGASVAVLMAMLVRLFLVLGLARIRLTDIVGYVGGSCGLFTLVVSSPEIFGEGAWAVLTAGVVGGVGWAARTIRARSRDPEHVLVGVFYVGKVPPATVNWIGFKGLKQ